MLGETDTLLGREFAGYRLIGVVGTGGMSTVYRGQPIDNAHDARMDDARAESAIKVLRESPRLTGSHAPFRARFYREAETVASLQHEHIMPVLDYGEWQGLPYMVMPLATGGTLATRITTEPGQFPLAVVVAYAEQLASALDYAHQHGIVHRDVKPANALLDEQGRLLLADFGIARVYEHSIRGDDATALTFPGEVVGTPSYMAPEQFQGQRVSPATDIYALGVVLYRLVTGCLPFEGETPLALGMAHLRDTPLSPWLLRPDLPVPAMVAILSALAKDPKGRFDSAGALAHAFAAGVEGRWTVENRARASALDRELTHYIPAMLGRERSRTVPRPSLSAGVATLCVAALIGGCITATQVVQNGRMQSAASTSRSPVVSASAPERAPVATTSSTLTAVEGTSYTLSASDGKVSSHVPAAAKHGSKHGKSHDGTGTGDNARDE
jgi:serine/threonine-protein kinase